MRERKHILSCKECNNQFEAYRPSDKFCSVSCRSTYYVRNNKDRRKELKKKWDENNKEHKRKYEREALLKPELKNYRRSYMLRRYFGITLEQYEDMLAKQNYKCAICEKPAEKEKRAFAVDHAHRASSHVPEGAVRGLLCTACNTRLIHSHVDPTLFRKAADYLEQHTGFFVPEEFTKGRKRKRRKKIDKSFSNL